MSGTIIFGIITLVVVSLLVYASLPPSTYSSLPDIEISDQEASDLALVAGSIAPTKLIFLESNDSIIARFLDEQGIGFTEKFGIKTDIEFYDSNQNLIPTVNDIFGIPQFSVLDTKGNLLDLGSVKITLQGLTRDVESSINIWGKFQVYMDDNIVPGGDNYFWASATNTNKVDLTIISSLSFDESDTQNIKRAIPPPLSQQKIKSFTYSQFAEDGKSWIDNSPHYFTVVITEIHAFVHSEKDRKEFHSYNQHIPYELKMTAVESTVIILKEDINGKITAVEVFKSDDTLILCGQNIEKRRTGTVGFVHEIAQPPRVIVKTLDGDVIVDASYKHVAGFNVGIVGTTIAGQVIFYSGSSCSLEFSGIPRGTDLIFVVNGIDYPVTTPLPNHKYIVKAQLDFSHKTSQEYTFCQSRQCGLIGTRTTSHYDDVDYSNFGYGEKYD